MRSHTPRIGDARTISKVASPDRRIVDCTSSATDRDTLMRCLESIETVASGPQSDAGRRVGGVRPPPINPVWSVPAWHINFLTGANTNTCVDSAHPCKDLLEIEARWGTQSPVITVGVGIFAHADDLTNWYTFTPQIVNGGAVWMVGDTTNVSSGTLASVAAKNPARAPVPELQADLGGAAAGAQGLQIVNTTRGSSVAWVDSVSGTVATLTQPQVANASGPPTKPAIRPGEVNTWANGDSFTTRRPVRLQFNQLVSNSSVGDAAGDQQFLYVQNLEAFDPVSPTFSSSLPVGGVLFVQARVSPFVLFNPGGSVFSALSNTWSPGGGLYASGVLVGGAMGTLNVPQTGVFLSNAELLDDTIIHGDIAVPQGNALEFTFVDSASCECLGVTVGGQMEVATRLYGNSGLGVGVISHGSLTYAGAAAAAFPGGQIALGFGDVGGAFAQFASAYDRSKTPGQMLPARALSVAQLDTSVAAGGFGGVAYGDNGGVITNGLQASAAPANYVAPVANGGLGNATPCPAGQSPVSNGTSYASCVAAGTGSGTLTNASVAGTGNWHSISGTLQGSASLGTALESLYTNSSATDEVWATIGGDVSLTTLTGTSGNGGAATYTVVGLEGTPVASTTPTAGQQLAFSSGAWRPTTGAGCPVNLATCSTGVLPVANGGLNRSTVCPTGQVPQSDGVGYPNCAAPGAGTLTNGSVTGTGNWHSISGTLQGAASLGNAFQSLYTNGAGSDEVWSNVTGDISLVSLTGTNGTSGNAHYLVTGLDGNPVAGTVPATNQLLGFSGGAWRPTTPTLSAMAVVNGTTCTPGCTTATASVTLAAGQKLWIVATGSFRDSNLGVDSNAQFGVGGGITQPCAALGTALSPFTGPLLFKDTAVSCVGMDATVGANTYSLNCGLGGSSTGITCIGSMLLAITTGL
jgi:hypothetical protein